MRIMRIHTQSPYEQNKSDIAEQIPIPMTLLNILLQPSTYLTIIK